MTTVAVLQPSYLPWLGYFDQISRADFFVLYNDVQFDKNGWRNRNRIKSSNGPVWLTVPVHANTSTLIKDVKIANDLSWRKKHLASLTQNYSKAPNFSHIFPAVEDILIEPLEYLEDLNYRLIKLITQKMEINTPILKSSELNVDGDRNTRLLNICKLFEATTYLTGNAASNYLDVELFESNSIKIEWQNFVHPVYPQRFSPFIPYLSSIDYLFNLEPSS